MSGPGDDGESEEVDLWGDDPPKLDDLFGEFIDLGDGSHADVLASEENGEAAPEDQHPAP